MDAHFEKIFSDGSKKEEFIAAASFTGPQAGYFFTNGARGIGYYLDQQQRQGKRKRVEFEAAEDDDGRTVPEKRTGESQQKSIEQLLEDADAANITQLDGHSLKQLLLSIEKKITKNQKLRMKFTDEPEKFMESELELHTELQELFAVAASPELYPTLVQTGAVTSLLGLLTHENTDISITTLSLLQELTDSDAIEEEEAAANTLIEAFIDGQGLELIVQNLSRLDESNEEDAQGVNNSLGVIENLVEAKSEVADIVCERTHILSFLLRRLRQKTFDANKLYCSEILCILLQSQPENQRRIGALIDDFDGMEALLQSIAVYRKMPVSNRDEQECVENLFLSLCAALQQEINQEKFLAAEGFELLLRCLREHQYAATCCIGVIECATAGNIACCERLIDIGGMKHIFPLLTSGGVKKLLVNSADKEGKDSNAKAKEKRQQTEESAVVVVAQLIATLGGSQKNDYSARLLLKMTEREHEKLERCVELYTKYARRLARADAEMQDTIAALEEAEDDEVLEEFLDADNIYAERLKGGLFHLQQLAIIICFACVFDTEHGDGNANTSLHKTVMRMQANDLPLEVMIEVLRDCLAAMRSKFEDTDNNQSSNIEHSFSESMQKEILQQVRKLTQWSAAFADAIARITY